MLSEFDAFEINTKEWLSPLVDTINAVDIWLENEIENFEFGKVLMSMISKVREINNILFADLNRNFRFYLFFIAHSFFLNQNGYRF